MKFMGFFSMKNMQLCGRLQRIWLIACIIAIGFFYLITIYFDVIIEEWRADRFFFTNKKHINLTNFNETTKRILFWNTMFGDETFYFGHGDVFKNCFELSNSCYATHDRYSINIEDFHAILFHSNELSSTDLPIKRNSGQKYIFVNLESPASRPLTNVLFENFFNSTMTYRIDSDIMWPYFIIKDKETNDIVAPMLNPVWKNTFLDTNATESDNKEMSKNYELVKKKKKTAVWFVSNCNSKSGREKYVDELSKYMDIDIYGRCGREVKCKKEEDCFKTVVEPNYFFYLSFENSFCQDYVTEKLSNALRHNVVPVVYGGANYTRFAPPNSYINALDFDNPKHLAQYLIRLTKEPFEYIKYFKWKEFYVVDDSSQSTICKLCKFLHNYNSTKQYNPMSYWYQNNKCPLQLKLSNFQYLTKSAIMYDD